MCGFVGIARLAGHDSNPQGETAFFEAASEQLSRRGPDDETLYQSDGLDVLFRRLSIVDVEGGRQPISARNGDLQCWVNGEIYNHQTLREQLGDRPYASQSDAAVIPFLYEEYGEQFVDHVQGMFAICLWDARQKKLVLVRDRIGIKPLYFAVTSAGVLFGSELKALLCHPSCPRDVNFVEAAADIASDCAPIPTYVRGIEHLPAGHLLVVEKGQVARPRVYWSLQERLWNPTFPVADAAAATERFHSLLHDSVEQRLMADVPLGVALSGGTDSSLVTAIVADRHSELLTFNVVERSTVVCGDAPTAADVAETCRAQHAALYFNPQIYADSFGLPTFELMVGLIESPRFDLEWFFKYKLYGLARTLVPTLKVVLLGQGADEFAGGYSNEGGAAATNWQQYLDERVRPGLRRSLAKELWSNAELAQYVDSANYPADCEFALSSYQQKMLRHANQLQHFNLWLEDRASSFVGVEARVPFLDHRIVELLAGLPPDLHPELFWDKAIVRSSLRKTLPNYPDDRPKIGFFDSHDRSGIDFLLASILTNAFPEFLRKYEDEVAEYFDVDRLWERFSATCQGKASVSQATYELTAVMALICFEALVRDPMGYMDAARDETPDPQILGHVTAKDLRRIVADESTPWAASLSDASRLRIAPTVRFCAELGAAANGAISVSVLDGQRVAAQFTAPATSGWITAFLERLSAEPAGVELGAMCDALGVELDQLGPFAANLLHRQFAVEA